MPGGLLRFRARGAKAWQVVALPSSHRSIWGVACTRRGALIATAQPAALYRLSGAKVVAKVKVPSEGLRSVTAVGDDVFAGGLTDGRVWRWRGQALTVVHVAPHPEVKELLAAPPGRLIVLSIGDAADDATDLPEPRPGSAGSGAVESLKLESLMAETLWRGSGSTPTDALLTTNDLWVVTDAGRLHRIDVSDDAVGVRRRHRRSSIADGRPIEAIWQHKKQLVLYGGGWELRPGRAPPLSLARSRCGWAPRPLGSPARRRPGDPIGPLAIWSRPKPQGLDWLAGDAWRRRALRPIRA